MKGLLIITLTMLGLAANADISTSGLVLVAKNGQVERKFDEDHSPYEAFSHIGYWLILPNDFLSGMSLRNRPDQRISNEALTRLMFDKNPQAFINNDINFLRLDSHLLPPTLEELEALPIRRGYPAFLPGELEARLRRKMGEDVPIPGMEEFQQDAPISDLHADDEKLLEDLAEPQETIQEPLKENPYSDVDESTRLALEKKAYEALFGDGRYRSLADPFEQQPSRLLKLFGLDGYSQHEHKVVGEINQNQTVRAIDNNNWSTRYELSSRYFLPDRDWPNWYVYSRFWLTSESDRFQSATAEQTTLVADDTATGYEQNYIALRELYLEKRRLFDDERYSLRVGRSRFKDKYGLWWDAALDTLMFKYDSTYQRGFLAVAATLGDLRSGGVPQTPQQRYKHYVLAEMSADWYAKQTLGVRFMYENDSSTKVRIGDNRPIFQGVRFGLFTDIDKRWRGKDLLFAADFMQLHGELWQRGIGPIHTSSWSFFSEFGMRWYDAPMKPRVLGVYAMTSSPAETGSVISFSPSALSSNRITRQGEFGSGMLGASFRFRFENTNVMGSQLRLSPTDRIHASAGWYSISRRTADNPVTSVIIADNTFDQVEQRHIGTILDAQLEWRSYPIRMFSRHFVIRSRLNTGVFQPNKAFPGLGNATHIGFGVEVNY